jgi:hypothetical protein
MRQIELEILKLLKASNNDFGDFHHGRSIYLQTISQGQILVDMHCFGKSP